MKSTDPSDAFNSLAPPVPDYNKTKINLSHFNMTRKDYILEVYLITDHFTGSPS